MHDVVKLMNVQIKYHIYDSDVLRKIVIKHCPAIETKPFLFDSLRALAFTDCCYSLAYLGVTI